MSIGVFVPNVDRDRLSSEDNSKSFFVLVLPLPFDAVPSDAPDVSAADVVVPENESVAVFTLDAALFGSAALTAGMNAVVTISTAMRSEKALSKRFILIAHHSGT